MFIRLLLLLAIAGEYPMRSLHLLGSSRTLEDLVHRLGHVQDFRTSTGADLGSCKMITTSGRGERRTIRLYKSALPLLQTLHPAALAHYLDITRNHRFSGSAEHIERNHRVAETVANVLGLRTWRHVLFYCLFSKGGQFSRLYWMGRVFTRQNP